MGFGADIKRKKERNLGEVLREVQAEDLLEASGLIPEFVGRLPVVATLEELDEDALVDILTKPKNALVKQYQKLFEFEEVRLRFTDGALRAVARQALERKSGARGLRSILESVMLDLMYDIPSRDDIEECVINEEVIEQGAEPLLVLKQEAESAYGVAFRERGQGSGERDGNLSERRRRRLSGGSTEIGRTMCPGRPAAAAARHRGLPPHGGAALRRRARSIQALEEAMANDGRDLLLCAQREAGEDEPGQDDIHEVGTLGTIIQLLRLPDGTVKVLVEGKSRAKHRPLRFE